MYLVSKFGSFLIPRATSSYHPFIARIFLFKPSVCWGTPIELPDTPRESRVDANRSQPQVLLGYLPMTRHDEWNAIQGTSWRDTRDTPKHRKAIGKTIGKPQETAGLILENMVGSFLHSHVFTRWHESQDG